MQDYSPTSHTALREYPDSLSWITLNDTAEIRWHMVINEYEIAIVVRQSTLDSELFVGQLITVLDAGINGRARMTSQSGTGDGVVIGLDRDITSQIRIGQLVWLVNQTPDGIALQSAGIDLATVVAIDASSVTVDGVTRTYAVGSLVGLEVQPVCVLTSPGGTPYFATDIAGGVTARNGDMADLAYQIIESEVDPQLDGTYPVWVTLARGGPSPNRNPRGKWQHFRVTVPGLTLVREDILKLDNGEEWVVFDEIFATNQWMTIGPK